MLFTNIVVDNGVERRVATLRIKPFPERRGREPLAAVFIEDERVAASVRTEAAGMPFDVGQEAQQRIGDLEQELQFTKENLQATIEELETSNEELQATNEELLSSNEELQSTNEELQSVNEELFTVNSEHQQKIIELTELTNDIDNLLIATGIATLFLGEELEVRKFTPNVSEIFRLIDNDLGRPLGDLAHHIVEGDPTPWIRQAAATRTPVEREVRTRSGKWFLMRALPYKIALDVYSGMVVTFTPIDGLVKARSEAKHRGELYALAERAVQMGSWRWDISSGVVEWSDSIESLFGFAPGTFPGTYAAFLECVHPEDRNQVEEAVSLALRGDVPYEVEHRVVRPDGDVRWMAELGEVTRDAGGIAVAMLGVVRDITRRKRADLTEARLRERLGDLALSDPQPNTRRPRKRGAQTSKPGR